MEPEGSSENPPEVRDHRRQWRKCLYVYPVISRRSKGLSIGVNLNPDKQCTFSCVYCQIDRRAKRGLTDVDIEILYDELHLALEAVATGRLWAEPRFVRTPPASRRVNDIAFSGDGEPTCLGSFDRAVAAAADAKADCGRDDVKLVVITNSTHLASPQLVRALPILDDNHGEIWAKFDAGTEEYFQRVNRPAAGLTLDKITADITSVARGRAVVIQSLFMRLDGRGPAPGEIEAYTARLRGILEAGGAMKLVQVHTIARPPAEPNVEALPDADLDALAETVRRALGGVPVEAYYGQDVHYRPRQAGRR